MFLEAKLSKLQEQVHPLIHDLAIKPSCATNAEISTTNLQYYLMNSQSDNNPPTSQEDKANDTLKTDDLAVVDTFRVPKSPKYMGTGPKPLKLTLLRREMLDIVKTQWQRYRNLLPRELSISSSTRFNGPTDADKVNAKEPVEQCEITVPAKNDQSPTPEESASL
ncbi:hypothetical protein P879_11513 [Paragonimus westermani]|uniref:Uncharacterized protein n=1 Tax=Paragonimus westermani TaxID=34504 RepID=A0A8T0DLU9_9TREM|nr:hypothetical protein P879_11513 [Paragonimus westermani]